MRKLSKSQRKQVRELLQLAFARELSGALEQLEASFHQWRAGGLDVFDLDEEIHKHHQGPSRKIWRKYSSESDWELALPAALHHGVLTVEDFPSELWDSIGPRLEEIKKGLFEIA